MENSENIRRTQLQNRKILTDSNLFYIYLVCFLLIYSSYKTNQFNNSLNKSKESRKLRSYHRRKQ